MQLDTIRRYGRREFLATGSTALFAAGVSPLSNPAGPSSRYPFLSREGGRLLLSWLDDDGNGMRSFRFAIHENGTWTRPRAIASGRRLMLNWADFPSVTFLPNGQLAAHWLERHDSAGAYGIRIAFARDPEASWITAFASTRPTADGYEGFVSLGASGQRVYASFLDHSKPVTALRVARFGSDGRFLDDRVVDGDVCSCCQTAIATAGGAPIVAYRGHTRGEVRDIRSVRVMEGRGSRPRVVSRDNWRINACPVNGPSLVADGQRAAVVWYTSATSPRVWLAFSEDPGGTYGAPIRIDDGRPIGRPDLALIPDSRSIRTAVIWLEHAEVGAQLRMRVVSPTLGASESITVAAVPGGRFSGFPRVVALSDRLVIAWTSDGGVTTSALPFALLPVPVG
jgi:hypothetical protein